MFVDTAVRLIVDEQKGEAQENHYIKNKDYERSQHIRQHPNHQNRYDEQQDGADEQDPKIAWQTQEREQQRVFVNILHRQVKGDHELVDIKLHHRKED